MDELAIFFQSLGKKIEASSDYRFSLQDPGQVWFLEKGSMILFAVEKKGEVEGKRILLSTVKEGELIFPIIRSQQMPFEIFAFSEQEVVLQELSLEQFYKGLESVTMREAFSPALEHWMHLFVPFLSTDFEIETDKWIQKKGSLFIKKEEVLSLRSSKNLVEREKIFWGCSEKEILKPLNQCEVELPKRLTSFPILPYQFFLGIESGQIVFKTTKQVIDDGTWTNGLLQFHIFFMHFFVKRQRKKREEEHKRFDEKEAIQSEALHESFNEMASILQQETAKEKTYSSDGLFQACYIVGKKMGIEISLPKRKDFKGTTTEKLDKIAHQSNIRISQANLKPGWWKKDVGPLLGFYGTKKHPIAILQNKWGFYEIYDPIQGITKNISSKLAQSIKKEVYRFHHCLPDDLYEGRKIFQLFLKRNKKVLGILGLYGFIAALLALFPPFAIAILFNKAIPNSNTYMLYQVFAGLLVAALSSSLFIYFRSLILGRIGGIASTEVQSSLWDRLLKLPASFFRRFDGGDLLTRVWVMDQLGPLFSSDVARIILTGIFAFSYLIIMAIYSIKLTIVGIIILLSSLGITYFCACYKIKMQKQVLALQGKINGALIQILSGIAKLRVAGAENHAFSYWASIYAKAKYFEMKGQYAQSFVAATMTAFPLLSFFAIFACVIQLEEAGKISTGAFLAYNAAFLTFSTALFELNNTCMQIAQVFPLLERSKVIIREKQELFAKQTHPGKLTGDIRIDHITFGYDPQNSPTLKDVSMHVQPHEMVGIVGPSGSGKSTLIRIILGFEKPQGGAVYYNGKDLTHLNINAVRKQMGVVLQGGGIIAGSIYQNIVTSGCYTQEEVDRAIQLSGFHRDLQSFPMGLHTMIPMNGETLSGGQKQRLLFARALLPRPKILLLDEATSALDNQSQDEIANNIDQLDVTRIVIAHRLSTVRNANRIYVIQEGSVVQSGTFRELAEQEGVFAEMLKRQKL